MKASKKGVCLLIVSLFLCVGLAHRVYTSSVLRHDRSKQIVENKKNIQDLENEVKAIHYEIKQSNSMDYVEQIAREDLGMVKPREIVFVDEGRNQTSQERAMEEGGK